MIFSSPMFFVRALRFLSPEDSIFFPDEWAFSWVFIVVETVCSWDLFYLTDEVCWVVPGVEVRPFFRDLNMFL
jgi:hypothetical protein